MLSDDEIDMRLTVALFELLEKHGDGKTICPSEVARHVAGRNEKEWRLLMTPIRALAVSLTHQDKLLITKKGKPVDPDNFKGLYRLSLPKQ